MKILFCALTRLQSNSVNINTRNIKQICSFLNQDKNIDANYVSIISGTDKISEEKLKTYTKKQWDVICFVYSSPYFLKDKLIELIQNQKNCKFGYLTSEYDLSYAALSYMQDKKLDFVFSNFVRPLFKPKVDLYKLINLNALIFNGRNEVTKKKYDKIYYGRWRKDRSEYFVKYFTKENNFYISTSTKNVPLYKAHKCHGTFLDKINWQPKKETLNYFKWSLYIEDKITHSNYNHLANRFYEGLITNTPCVFDVSCKNTIDKSGYYIPDDFYFDNYLKADPKLIEKYLTINSEKAMADKQECLSAIKDALLGL